MGVYCVAVPILDRNGRPVGALSITGPSPKKAGPRGRAAGRDAERGLRHHQPAPRLCRRLAAGRGGAAAPARRARARRELRMTYRHAWVMKLKPGNEAIYKQKHDEIWPEMLAN